VTNLQSVCKLGVPQVLPNRLNEIWGLGCALFLCGCAPDTQMVVSGVARAADGSPLPFTPLEFEHTSGPSCLTAPSARFLESDGEGR
jgi:hypothetical protein